MATNVYATCVLVLIGLLFVLSAKWEDLLSHVPMFVAGTAFFLLPGAFLKREQLWYFQPRTEAIALSAMLTSVVCVWSGYVAGVTKRYITHDWPVLPKKQAFLYVNKSQTTSAPGDCPPIPTRVVTLLFIACIVIKLFLDHDTILADHLLLIPVGLNAAVWAKILLELSYAPVAAACLTPWLLRNASTQTRTIKLMMVGLVAVGVFSTSRTPAFYVLGTLIFFWLWKNHPKWSTAAGRLLFLTAVGVMLPVIIFLGAFVKGSDLLSEQFSGDEASDRSVSDVVNFAVEQQYKIAISDAYGNLLFAIDHYPRTYDYDPTLSLASIVTAVIPRSWMPSKGYTPSYVLTSEILGAGIFERTGNSLATSFVGELWMNLGWIAVVLGSFGLGLLGAGFRRLAGMNWHGSYKHILFLMSLVAFFVTPRGDVFSTTLRGCFYIGMAWVIARCVILLSRRAQPKGHLYSVRTPFRRSVVMKSPSPASTPWAF